MKDHYWDKEDKLTHEIGAAIGWAYGWFGPDYECWASPSGKEYDAPGGPRWDPAKSRDDFCQHVLPEIQKRGLEREFVGHLRRISKLRILELSDRLDLAIEMLLAPPDVLCLAALEAFQPEQLCS